MAYGEIYVEVDASVIGGGIMPMAMISGNPQPVDGQSYVVVWIRWRYDDATGDGGYTGTGWYFNDQNNNISAHFNSEADFKRWLTTKKPSDLNDVLNDWNAANKAEFLNEHLGILQAGDCVYFTGQSGS